MASRGRGKKRARLEDTEEETVEEEGGGSSSRVSDAEKDMKLCDGLSALLGNRQYVKKKELTRELLLSYLEKKGDIAAVKLVKVSVQEMGGRTFGVTLDDSVSTVGALKSAVADEQGFVRWSQNLFRFGGGGGASAAPLADSVVVRDEDHFALCVDGQGEFRILLVCFDLICLAFVVQMAGSGTFLHLCFLGRQSSSS